MYATASSSRLRIKRLVLSALMLALAYVLPFFTGNIPQIGSMLLPMHLPVLLCGFLLYISINPRHIHLSRMPRCA